MFKSMRSKFFLLTLINLLIMFVLITFIFAANQRNHLKERAIENSMDMSRIYADNIGLQIGTYAEILKTIANQPRAKALDQNYLLVELRKIVDNNPEIFMNAVYLDMDAILHDIDGNNQDVSGSYFFEIFKNSENDFEIIPVGIGTIINVPRFAIGALIRDEQGNNIGSIGVSIDVFAFFKSIQDLKLVGESYPWITDQVGRVATHPNENYPYYVTLQDSAALGYEGFQEIADNILAGKEGFGEYLDTNISESKIITYAQIPNTPGWSLNITTQEKDIFKDTDIFIRNSIIILFIILLVCSVIFLQISGKIVSPLKSLADEVRKIGNRRFVKVESKTSTLEVRQLIDAHNEMTDKISNYTDNLEALVKERTIELDKLNVQLNEQNEKLVVAVQSLNIQASMDSLTNLHNRYALYKYLYLMISRIEKGTTDNFTVLFLDLDSFKYFNDTFGHNIGDYILEGVSKILKSVLRDNDFISRYGGDEFVIILNDTSEHAVISVVEKVTNSIRNYNNKILEYVKKIDKACQIESFEYPLDISVGICTVTSNTILSPDEIIKVADENMYDVKNKKKTKRHKYD